jgi:serine/threonine protein kinase
MNVKMKMRPQKLISKIENEFQQIKVLGIGSFGKVFSVQHLLDQQIYAIKKFGIDEKK